ncbi:MAG: YgjP-like metallopeptidase domain-containing protein [Flavobacteriales bacterium AspAUS03]
MIIHELYHLINYNHNNHIAAFFELQSCMMPDWELWEDRLE